MRSGLFARAPQVAPLIVLYCAGELIRVYNPHAYSHNALENSSHHHKITHDNASLEELFSQLKELKLFVLKTEASLYRELELTNLKKKGLDPAQFSPLVYKLTVNRQLLVNQQLRSVRTNDKEMQYYLIPNSESIRPDSAYLTLINETIPLNQTQRALNCNIM
jgi:hypothetical protein